MGVRLSFATALIRAERNWLLGGDLGIVVDAEAMSGPGAVDGQRQHRPFEAVGGAPVPVHGRQAEQRPARGVDMVVEAPVQRDDLVRPAAFMQPYPGEI